MTERQAPYMGQVASKQLIQVEPTAGGWRVLARQEAGVMFQVTIVPSETEAWDIAECLRVTNALAASEALVRQIECGCIENEVLGVLPVFRNTTTSFLNLPLSDFVSID